MDNLNEMYVVKRNGNLEGLLFDKILNRIRNLGVTAGIYINYQSLIMKVIDQLFDKIHTSKIDELAAEQCAVMSTNHPDYAILAGRIVVSNHHKNTDPSFFNVIKKLYEFKDINNMKNPLISDSLWEFTKKYKNELDRMIVHDRDYFIDYFGFKTLERAYLFRIGNKILERPQHMWLRVAIGIHGDIDNPESMSFVKETYDLMSLKYFTHATPTLFNAGTPRQQLSSCYLIGMENDSLDGIYNTLHDCAMISKYAGGVGLHIHDIRSKGSHIQGTNGQSNGIVPMLRVFNNTARYVDQCVHPETIIYTNKGPIQIQHCSIGETKIFNLKGECEVIENVLEQPYKGEIYNIQTYGCIDNLKITPEHPVFVLRDKILNYSTIQKQVDKNVISFEWVEAKNLNINDFLVYKIPDYNFDIDTLTEDDCQIYGLILAYGKMDNIDEYYELSLDNDMNSIFCVNYLEKKYIQHTIQKCGNITKISWKKNINLPFRYNDFFDVNKNKHIQSRWLNLPIQKSKFILKGLLQNIYDLYKDFLLFDNISKILIEGVRFICLKMSLFPKIEINQTKSKKLYSLIISKTIDVCDLMNIHYPIPTDSRLDSYDSFELFIEPPVYNFFKYKDYLLIKIKNITTNEYNGTLYDLQMKNEHNYLIHNGIIHNGGGKRNGSFAIYLEPWHADVEDFLEMKKNHGDEESKARDLFYALWIPDLFMERVKNNGKWSLMCPHECKGLSDVYGIDFIKLYEKYELEGKVRKSINARDLWFKILDAQMETGTPYLLYKDSANFKSNQKNLGTIKSSNLCCEIIEYSDDKETAVCNLASIALPTFVDQKTKQFDYDKLHKVTKVVTNNLNRVIDINYYPTEKTKKSNMKHRPIGIGVQGLADMFILMNIPFHSEKAKEVNKFIFETIYHASLEKSNEIAIERRKMILNNDASRFDLLNEWEYDAFFKSIKKDDCIGSYSSFKNSPASNGILQFDMWNAEPTCKYDWNSLKKSIIKYGIRNSLLVAPMPTASTSQILGFNECFEPFTSNLYTRRTLAGEFIVVNKYLMRELIDLGCWNEEIKNNIIANKGSIQQLTMLNEEIRNKYKIVWEIPMKHIIDMAADRGAYICQSQSMNLWIEDPTYNTLTSMHFYSWKKGLKTGIYYLRRKAKHQAQQFTIEPEEKHNHENEENKKNAENDEICEMCSA